MRVFFYCNFHTKISTYLVLALLFITFNLRTFAQKNSSNNSSFCLNLGYSYNKTNFLQAACALVKYKESKFHFKSVFSVGMDIGYNNNQIIIGPKVSYLKSIFNGQLIGLDVTNYMSANENDLRLIPRFGFELFGISEFFLGYGYPMQGKEMSNIGRYSISIEIYFLRDRKK